MSIYKPTLITASALGVLFTLGSVTTASAGHGGYGYTPYGGYAAPHGYYHGYTMPGGYGYGGPARGYIPHPMYHHGGGGQSGYGSGKSYGKGDGCGGAKKTGYMIKTGMYKTGSKEAAAPEGDIVEVAVSAGSFSTLVAALKAADLVDTLKGSGPFTVFAPTDEAFAKIPKADLDALLADKEKLTAVLTYHVVPGKVMAADVIKLKEAKTVQGESITIDASDGVTVDGAKVVKTDIMTSNGVIHVIDTVIMPTP